MKNEENEEMIANYLILMMAALLGILLLFEGLNSLLP
jgi:hypothetical protein